MAFRDIIPAIMTESYDLGADIDIFPAIFSNEAQVDILGTVLTRVGALADAALEACSDGEGKKAISYRGAHVGAAAFGVRLDTDSDGVFVEMPMFVTGNIKPQPYSNPVCAEEGIFGLAEKKASVITIPLLVVASNFTEQPEIRTIMNRPSNVVYPCETKCAHMARDQRVVDRGTIVICVRLDERYGRVYEVARAGDLPRKYEEEPRPLHNIPFYEMTDKTAEDAARAFRALMAENARRRKPLTPAFLAYQALKLKHNLHYVDV